MNYRLLLVAVLYSCNLSYASESAMQVPDYVAVIPYAYIPNKGPALLLKQGGAGKWHLIAGGNNNGVSDEKSLIALRDTIFAKGTKGLTMIPADKRRMLKITDRDSGQLIYAYFVNIKPVAKFDDITLGDAKLIWKSFKELVGKDMVLLDDAALQVLNSDEWLNQIKPKLEEAQKKAGAVSAQSASKPAGTIVKKPLIKKLTPAGAPAKKPLIKKALKPAGA